MKAVLLGVFLFITATNTYSQDRYIKEMKSGVENIGTAKSLYEFIKIANKFERIAFAEKVKWLPYYYSAFVYVLASYSDSSTINKDSYLDKADLYILKADSLEPNNSEIYTLKGMIAQARMQVDPMNRWAKYVAESNNNFKKAIELDSLNPRPEYLIGVSLFYTPDQFGGGPIVAKPVLEKSLEKYNKFVPKDDLMPNWGRETVEKILDKIVEEK